MRKLWDEDSTRGVLIESQVSPGAITVVKIRFQDTPQTSFVEYDDMIQTLSSSGSDNAFHEGILPGGLCREEVADRLKAAVC